jgi:hypothetical protein
MLHIEPEGLPTSLARTYHDPFPPPFHIPSILFDYHLTP